MSSLIVSREKWLFQNQLFTSPCGSFQRNPTVLAIGSLCNTYRTYIKIFLTMLTIISFQVSIKKSGTIVAGDKGFYQCVHFHAHTSLVSDIVNIHYKHLLAEIVPFMKKKTITSISFFHS